MIIISDSGATKHLHIVQRKKVRGKLTKIYQNAQV